MMFAIKAEIGDPRVKTFAFSAQKTMHSGKHIAAGDTVFVFASENEGGKVSLRAALSVRCRRPRGSAASPGTPLGQHRRSTGGVSMTTFAAVRGSQ
jgi:hypothetical protein